MFKEPSRFPELADPLLKGEFPVRGLNQAVAVAAMCLHEEPAVRPLISDVVTALSFLGTDPDQTTVPVSVPSPASDKNSGDHRDATERQRAVAEAMEWGSNSRNQSESGTASLL